MDLYLLVSIAEMIAAANDMNRAMESYQEAVAQCKSAGDDLASKWEGEAKEAFVAHQETAFSWYKQMIQTVLQMVDVVRKAADEYTRMEETVKSIIHGA